MPVVGTLGPPPVSPVENEEIPLVQGIMITNDDLNELPFAIVENPPRFPNTPKDLNKEEGKKYGIDRLHEFIRSNFDVKVLDSTILGRHKISTKFTIDTTGQITDIEIKAKYKVLESESFRVLRSLPNFEPGKDYHDNKVNVVYVLPIIFENE